MSMARAATLTNFLFQSPQDRFVEPMKRITLPRFAQYCSKAGAMITFIAAQKTRLTARQSFARP